MDNTPSIKKIVLTLLYVSLGLVAVGSIGLIMFGASGEYGTNLFGTIGLIILSDLFILGALFSRHDWLRYSTWIMSSLGFIFAGIALWLPKQDNYTEPGYIVYEDPSRHLSEILSNIGTAFYLIAVSLLIVGVMSLIYKKARTTNKVSHIAYWIALCAFPIGTLPAAVGLALQYDSTAHFPLQWRFYVSMLILTITAFLVVVIAIIASIINRKNSTPQQQQRLSYPVPQNPQPPYQHMGQQYPPVHPQQQYPPVMDPHIRQQPPPPPYPPGQYPPQQ